MHYAIWPEGQPELAFHTESGWAALRHRWKKQLFFNLPWNWRFARRMRVTTCEEGPISPEYIEQSLREDGATTPPGGWPKIQYIYPNPHQGDVKTVTLSVI